MRIVLDTNVLISVLLNPHSSSATILRQILIGSVLLLADDRILLEYEEVEFVEWKVAHPLISNPEFYVRVSKGNVKKVVKKAIEELKKDIEDLQKQLE